MKPPRARADAANQAIMVRIVPRKLPRISHPVHRSRDEGAGDVRHSSRRQTFRHRVLASCKVVADISSEKEFHSNSHKFLDIWTPVHSVSQFHHRNILQALT